MNRQEPPQSGKRPRGNFLNRLGIYLLGVAIGLFMVGMLWKARLRAVTGQPQQPPPSASSPAK